MCVDCFRYAAPLPRCKLLNDFSIFEEIEQRHSPDLELL